MNTLYIYNKNTGLFLREDSGSYTWIVYDLKPYEDFTLVKPPDYNRVWRWVDTRWVELLPINNPNIPYGDEYIWNEEQNQWVISPELDAYKYLENQDIVWERIKERRLQAITSGVYVESVDKWFHTDEVSVTTYSTIAGMIALNNYEPLQWKVMDNTWLLLTEPLFKELQTAISQKTNTNYAIAEQHKAAMLQADDPLDYDYSTDWV
ncbi:DUF4376 domain-containing protein [uncultured Psychrobacter sp.]|uniref:DUF4376 domain-containing protein n=1 Tax=uncultured Psychrobacter sp. TaxID=259303 RepID=UPI0026100C28|nr:DUF4376 domain-containing protein [uncultured Psychrobacter sp.]